MTAKGRIYKCLNPLGIQEPVDCYPLAPRLGRLDGKTILFNIMPQIENEFIAPLKEMLKDKYSQVNWVFRESGPPITEAELNKADALIQGVAF